MAGRKHSKCTARAHQRFIGLRRLVQIGVALRVRAKVNIHLRFPAVNGDNRANQRLRSLFLLGFLIVALRLPGGTAFGQFFSQLCLSHSQPFRSALPQVRRADSRKQHDSRGKQHHQNDVGRRPPAQHQQGSAQNHTQYAAAEQRGLPCTVQCLHRLCQVHSGNVHV